MKLKCTIIFVSIILSVILVPSVDVLVNISRFSRMGTLGGYIPWIERLEHFNNTNAGGSLFLLSALLMIALIVMIRRAYTGRLNRLLHVAIPVPIALFLYTLLEARIDVHFREHDYIGFLKMFFSGLPEYFMAGYFIGYTIVGLVLFLLILLIYYPISILIDKLLLYTRRRIKRNIA